MKKKTRMKVTEIFRDSTFRDVCNSNFLQLQLVVTPDLMPNKSGNEKVFALKFDRIFTGLAADVYTMPQVLDFCLPYLNLKNRFATILTFHRVWRMDKR